MYFQLDNSRQLQFIWINAALTQTNVYEPQVATMQTRRQGLDKKKIQIKLRSIKALEGQVTVRDNQGMPLLAQFSLARFSGAHIWSAPLITANSQ